MTGRPAGDDGVPGSPEGITGGALMAAPPDRGTGRRGRLAPARPIDVTWVRLFLPEGPGAGAPYPAVPVPAPAVTYIPLSPRATGSAPVPGADGTSGVLETARRHIDTVSDPPIQSRRRPGVIASAREA